MNAHKTANYAGADHVREKGAYIQSPTKFRGKIEAIKAYLHKSLSGDGWKGKTTQSAGGHSRIRLSEQVKNLNQHRAEPLASHHGLVES